jgi:glycosyltransferase involved in cell wall biosynthesis
MFHEVVFPLSWKQPMLHSILGVVTRLMAWLTVRASKHVYVSIPAWADLVIAIFSQPRDITWLPIPSNIPVVDDAEKTSDIRSRYLTTERFLIGHFGTYGQQISDMLMALLPVMLAKYEDQTVVLIGRGSDAFRHKLISNSPMLDGRVYATGAVSDAEVSQHLSACDALIQPYPDGVSSRRSSVMAGLAHGRPIVTNVGPLTEPLWAESGAVILVPVEDTPAMVEAIRRLLMGENEKKRVGTVARTLYQEKFDVRHTIAALRDAAA